MMSEELAADGGVGSAGGDGGLARSRRRCRLRESAGKKGEGIGDGGKEDGPLQWAGLFRIKGIGTSDWSVQARGKVGDLWALKATGPHRSQKQHTNLTNTSGWLTSESRKYAAEIRRRRPPSPSPHPPRTSAAAGEEMEGEERNGKPPEERRIVCMRAAAGEGLRGKREGSARYRVIFYRRVWSSCLGLESEVGGASPYCSESEWRNEAAEGASC
ncbi:hypothetical protein Droror1_Dr00006975 [Drosera rotundifolia]